MQRPDYPTILRFEVPVDDEWHEYVLTGGIVHVATRRPDVVEFWADHNPAANERKRLLRVIGTGHPKDRGTRHVGTAVVPGGALVWHLIESAA